jgi:Kef-type K+ transport system membrane component KefB
MVGARHARIAVGLAVAAVVVLAPEAALAAEPTPTALRTVLTLLAILGAAYLITHLALERIARRFAVVTGVEYILVGAALGPVLGVIDAETTRLLRPALTLGTGALGLLAGLSLRFAGFERQDLRSFSSALMVSLVTLAAVVGLPAVLLSQLGGERLSFWLPGLLLLGAVALVADPSPVQSLARFLQAKGAAPAFGARTADFCSMLAVLAFGGVFCVYEGGPMLGRRALPSWAWFLLQLAVGVVLGLVFRALLRAERRPERLLPVLIGIVTFTSGVAFYLRVSVIFTSLVLGAVLVNTFERGEQLRHRLASVRRPLHIVLFFFAGVFLRLDVPWWAYALGLPYVALRVWGRSLGGAFARRLAVADSPPLPGPGPALLAPGGLSVAMMLNFRISYQDHAPLPEIYSALLLGVVLSEVLAYLLARRWLIDAADVPPALAERRGGFEELEELR